MARAAGTATARKPAPARPAARPPARRKSGPARSPRPSAASGAAAARAARAAARAKPAGKRASSAALTKPATRRATGSTRAKPAPRRAVAPARAKPGSRRSAAPRPPLAARPLRTLAGVAARQVSRERAGALLDRLLRGRAWVLCVGVLLAGIVFFNVSLLELNSGITRTNERAAALKRENAGLRQEVASLGSSERIQALAAERGMVLPAPADVHYVHANPAVDAPRALRQMGEPAPATAPAYGVQTPAPAVDPPAAGAPTGVTAPVTPSPPPQPAPAAPQPTPQQPAPAAPQQAPGPAAQG